MEDYKEIIKQMLLRDFSSSPIPSQGGENAQPSPKAPSPWERVGVRMTTFEILQMVQGIIPQTPIDEHNVFEVMQELGFKYELTLVDEEKMLYLWCMYKKD